MGVPKAMAFVDGENLVFRFQEMVKAGRVPASDIVHIPDRFVWHKSFTTWCMLDLMRVCYYTSAVSDDPGLYKLRTDIAKVNYEYEWETGQTATSSGQIVPFVFKKEHRSKTSRKVDINIAIDVMRAAYLADLEVIYLLSGDGDFLPLITEAMRHGKQVLLGAFSSGLDERLVYSVDEFTRLDELAFRAGSE